MGKPRLIYLYYPHAPLFTFNRFTQYKTPLIESRGKKEKLIHFYIFLKNGISLLILFYP